MNLKVNLFKFAVVGTRLFLGLIFFTSGMGKLTGGDFPGLIGPVHLEQSLAPYGLGLWVIRRVVANQRRAAFIIATVCHAWRDYAAADDCQYFNRYRFAAMAGNAVY